MEKFLIKLNRFSAWVLLVLIILFIISGYGMIKQIINPVFATYLHNELLPIPLFIFFVLHIAISSSYALRRWRVFSGQKRIYAYILIFSFVLWTFFFWMFFR